MSEPRPESLVFEDDGSIPNNPDLAVLIYRGAIPDADNIRAVPHPERDPVTGGPIWRD